MNCVKCSTKSCKSDGKDCTGAHDEMLEVYSHDHFHSTYLNSDKLVAGGKAGNLSRLEEIAEFCELQEYETVGIAYCYSMEDLAKETADYLTSSGIKIHSYRCTLGGIRENEIDSSMGKSVNCNPVGQALALKKDGIDLVVEMGLCLGHDVMFHEALEVPHTVFVVKDRVYNHNPARALANYKDSADAFIDSLDSSFNMKSHEWLVQKLKSRENIIILDLRTPENFAEEHIAKSINIPLKDIPAQYRTLPKDRDIEIICVCNGNVQSAYALAYLFSRGYRKVYNLSGGFSRFKKESPGHIEKLTNMFLE